MLFDILLKNLDLLLQVANHHLSCFPKPFITILSQCFGEVHRGGMASNPTFTQSPEEEVAARRVIDRYI